MDFYETKRQHSLNNEEKNGFSELPNLKFFCHDTVLCDASGNVLTPRTLHLDIFVTNKNIGKTSHRFSHRLFVCFVFLIDPLRLISCSCLASSPAFDTR